MSMFIRIRDLNCIVVVGHFHVAEKAKKNAEIWFKTKATFLRISNATQLKVTYSWDELCE